MSPVGVVLELLAPSRCLSCRRRGPLPWCEVCAGEVRVLPPGCARCATPRGAAHACWPPDAPIDATVAAFDYRGPVAAAVVTAKVAGARAGWPALGAALAARMAEAALDADVVTWVTTPAERVRARGCDHARLLAVEVARAVGLTCVGLLDARRGSQDRDRYRASRSLPGTHVLRVDDVVTTGATAWRAASCLLTAGAGRVELAVLARAGTHPLGAVSR